VKPNAVKAFVEGAGLSRLCVALVAMAAVASGGAVQAQSLTLFGLYDAALEHVTDVGPGRAGLNRMPSLTGSFPSRIGLRGAEELGGGLRANFIIEEGFTPDMGTISQGGRAWGRQAWVGLSGPWGAVSLGRQYTMLYWSILDADVLGPSLYGSGSLDAYVPNARADNVFVYKGSFGGVTLGASFSLGRDAVSGGSPAATGCPGESADSKACREWSTLIKYDNPAWGAALAVDEIRGGPGAFAGLTSSALADRRVSANGYAQLGRVKATLGLIRRNNGASVSVPRSDLWYAGASMPLAAGWALEAEVFSLAFKGSADKAVLGAGRVTYNLSRRTALYTTFGRIANRGGLALSVSAGAGGSNPNVGAGQHALALGVRHGF
jgi:predicted porin